MILFVYYKDWNLKHAKIFSTGLSYQWSNVDYMFIVRHYFYFNCQCFIHIAHYCKTCTLLLHILYDIFYENVILGHCLHSCHIACITFITHWKYWAFILWSKCIQWQLFVKSFLNTSGNGMFVLVINSYSEKSKTIAMMYIKHL